MKVSMITGAGASVKIKTRSGTMIETEDIESIEVTPFFSREKGPGEVIRITSITERDVKLDSAVLEASGVDGKLRVRPIPVPVVPLADQDEKEEKA